MAALFDLVFLLPLLAVLAIGVVCLRRRLARSGPKVAAGGPAAPLPAGSRPPGRPGRSAAFGLTGIGVMLAVAAIIVLVIASQLGAFNPVIAPSAGEAAGVWKGAHGATLTLAADGTFTASGLPAGMGDWADGSTPVSGSGTWHVGRFDPSTPPGVVLGFANGSQCELQLEQDGPTLAMFYDLGDPDQGWSGQYRLARQ